MNISQSISACFANYFNFKGRASRSEYWWFYLFCLLLSALGSLVDAATGYAGGYGTMYWLIVAATFFPSLTAAVRRLHDVGKSGWWLLIAFTIIGLIPLIIWMASQGIKQNNLYGKPIKLKNN